MEALIVTWENPFLEERGDAIYTRNLLEGLNAINCRPDLIFFGNDVIRDDSGSISIGNCHFVAFKSKPKFRVGLSVYPGMVANRRRQNFLNLLKAVCAEKDYDCVIINHFKMSFCMPVLRNECVHYFAHNNEAGLLWNNFRFEKALFPKLVFFQDWVKTRLYEDAFLRRVKTVSTISSGDSQELATRIKKPISVLRPILNISNERAAVHSDPKKLLVVGSYTWAPKESNLLALLSSFEKHKLADAGIKLTVVGKMNERAKAKTLATRGVEYIGFAENLDPYYAACDVAIVPETMGGGFKLKLSEAAGYGKVIYAIRDAVNSDDFVHGKHLLMFDEIDSLVKAIKDNSRLSHSEFAEIRQNGIELIRQKYSRKHFGQVLKRIFHGYNC